MEMDEGMSEELQTWAFRSPLYLAQALGQQDLEGSFRIAFISNDMQEVVGEKNLMAEKSLALGPCKVIPQEYANISCQSIDLLIGEGSGLDISNAADLLLAELNSDANDMVVAYRGNHRWVRTFEPLPLESSQKAEARLRSGGVYLITGGLGGVGLELALYLAQSARARLALVGRSSFPEREDWGNWLSDHGEDDEISSRIEKLLAIEELGGEVLILKADVSDLEQMGRAIDTVCNRFGHINGVIHASGVGQGNIIQMQTPEVIDYHLAAKVNGSRIIESLFGRSKLDFLALCSSQTSILGGIGLVGYCAANAFLDAFSYYYATKYDTFTVSINWDRWRSLGMAAGVEVMHKKLTGEDLQGGMTAEEGRDAFGRILRNATTHQVIVSVSDFITEVEHNSDFTATSALKEIEEAHASGASHPRPILNNAYVPPRNDVERSLAGIFQELLGLDQVGINDNFFELGGHSLLATRLISRLRSQHAADITLKEFFATPTVGELADLLELRIIENSESAKVDELMNMLEQMDEEKAEHLAALDNLLNED
jgi:NAD(P)-dependent dehydrogenase (short-subunit alcohol dehydrogenase family)/acyl carrier protein